MKKFLSLILVLVLASGLFPMTAKASGFIKGISASCTGSIRVGQTCKVTVTADLDDGTKMVLNDTDGFQNLVFTVPINSSISFNNDGTNAYVTGISNGDTIGLSVRYGTPSSTINACFYLQVYDLLALLPSYNYVDITKSTTRRITVKADWSDREAEDVTDKCTFESENPAVAVVSQSPDNPTVDGSSPSQTGRVYPVSSGTTKIKVTYDNKTIEIPVSVMGIKIGSQTGTPIAGTGGSTTYAVSAPGLFDGAPLAIIWCNADGTSAQAPAGITAPDTTISSYSSTFTVTADSTAKAGTYYFKLYSHTIDDPTSDSVASFTVLSDTRSSAKSITNFSIGGSTGVIDENSHTVSVTVPYSTNVTSLAPTITTSAKATVSPASGVAQNFTSPVTYKVTAENGTTQDYTVNVTRAPGSSEKDVKSFSINGSSGTIDNSSHTISVTVPYSTNVTSLAPTITTSAKATVSPAGGTAQNFSSPVKYTVTAEDGSKQDYTVTVTREPGSSEKDIKSFSINGNSGIIDNSGHTIAVTVPYGTDITNPAPSITVSDKAAVSPTSGNVQNFSSPVKYTVTAEDSTTQDYTVTVTVAPNTEKAITGFKINGVNGTIDGTNHTVAVTVPYGTDITNLSPTITVSAKATISPTSGTAKDFTNPVTYTVTAEDGSKQDYTVTVTVALNTAKAITSFKINGVDATIDETNHKITYTAPYGTDVTNFSPTITVSEKAVISPENGAAKDFTSPVTYTVTAEDGSKQDYNVTVTVALNTAKAITGFMINGENGSIDEKKHTIAITMPYGTDVTKLKPTITISEKAVVSPTSGTEKDFTKPVVYTVTAQDETTQDYTVTVTVAAYTSSGSGSSSGLPDIKPENPPVEKHKTEVTVTTTTEANIDNSGKATAAVTQIQVNDAVRKAAEEATKQGNKTQVVVEIKVEAPADTKAVETSLPKTAVDIVADSKTNALTISTPIADITFDDKSIETIAGQAADDVKISAAKVETATLSEEARQMVDDRPVYNFSVTSGNNTISQFEGNVTVAVPYTPRPGENTDAIVIYYINAQGNLQMVSNCKFDAATGTISFVTNHFSQYAVGYNKISFKDVPEDVWYNKAVNFIASRGITTGTGNGNYSPGAKLTRGEFLVMAMRAYGIAPDESPRDNFSDAGNTYYTGYLAAAKRLGIAGGVGNNLYAPDKEITRQEMFTMLYNALKVIGQIPEGNSGEQLSDFSDAGKIASWAKDAMKLMVESSIIAGSDGKLSPQGTATRAEMAQVLYNLFIK
ncbi:MAG: DUF5018 domain-containing protein [Bacillota bacterium]|nr:DUF5018 domain-containing protein [Bacillota bacterium]